MSEEKKMPQVAIPLTKGKKTAVQLGCACLMLFIAMSASAINIMLSPVLQEMGAMAYISLFSLFASVGVALMTPIGGKLGDLFGRRNIVVIPGILAALCVCGIAVIRSVFPLLALRLLLALAQGAFTAAPYIIVSTINERKDIPKAMGMLATATAVGGFGGSMIAGALADMGMMVMALLVPVIPLAIGIVTIGLFLPNVKRPGKITMDIPGIILLAVALIPLTLAMNFAPKMGITNPIIIAGLLIGIGAFVALVKVEGKAAEPLIPLKLLKNGKYTVMLLVGFICYYYMNSINFYAPIGMIQVMGAAKTISGSLQLPKTLITVFLPTVAGVWVGKKAANSWKAMAIATLLMAGPLLCMSFTSPTLPILVYFAAVTVIGVAESFRAVSITPAAQSHLDPKDMGIGTAMINFCNSLAGTFSSAVNSIAYNSATAADPGNIVNIQAGVNSVFRISALIAVAGLLVVLFVVRPQYNKAETAKQTV